MSDSAGVKTPTGSVSEQCRGKFHTIFNALNIAVVMCEINDEGMPGEIIEVNDSACALLQYSRDEMRMMEFFDISVKTADKPGLSRIKTFLETGSIDYDLTVITNDGSPLSVEISLRRIDLDDEKAVLVLLREMTAVNKLDNDIRRINRLYLTLNHINLAVMKYREEEPLFQAVCHAAYAYGHYNLAWIGVIDAATGTIRLAAQSGDNGRLLQQLTDDVQQIRRDQGPTWTAIRDGKLAICNDIDNYPQTIPWREPAVAFGFKSMAAIPVLLENNVTAVLNLYSSEPDFITREEHQLLQEIRLGLSCAADCINSHSLRRQAEKAIHDNEMFLSAAINSIQEGFSVLDSELTVTYANSLLRTWYAANQPIEGKKCYHVYHNSDHACEPCPSVRCMKSGKTESEIVPGPPGFAAEWIELFSYPVKDAETGAIRGVVELARDITRQIKMKEKNQRNKS